MMCSIFIFHIFVIELRCLEFISNFIFAVKKIEKALILLSDEEWQKVTLPLDTPNPAIVIIVKKAVLVDLFSLLFLFSNALYEWNSIRPHYRHSFKERCLRLLGGLSTKENYISRVIPIFDSTCGIFYRYQLLISYIATRFGRTLFSFLAVSSCFPFNISIKLSRVKQNLI